MSTWGINTNQNLAKPGEVPGPGQADSMPTLASNQPGQVGRLQHTPDSARWGSAAWRLQTPRPQAAGTSLPKKTSPPWSYNQLFGTYPRGTLHFQQRWGPTAHPKPPHPPLTTLWIWYSLSHDEGWGGEVWKRHSPDFRVPLGRLISQYHVRHNTRFIHEHRLEHMTW